MHKHNASIHEELAHHWFRQHMDQITRHTRARLNHLRLEAREEAEAEVLGFAFQSGLSAARSGRLCLLSPSKVVEFALRQRRCGRRIGGYSSTDVTSEAAQVKGRANVVLFSCPVSSPAARGDASADVSVGETLADRRQDANPFEQARKRIDYPLILRTEKLSRKARRLFALLSAVQGRGSGKRIAQTLGISTGRVCQLKRQLAEALTKRGYAPA